MSLSNLLKVYEQADRIDLEEGRYAYEHYRQTIRLLANHYGFRFEQVVAAFVALSPNSDYIGNLRSTVSVMKGVNKGLRSEQITVSTYNHCKERAIMYLTGTDFLSHATGPKTRSFYQNIINPKDPEPVTIDGHMANCFIGKPIPLKQVLRSIDNYDRISEYFRLGARFLNILPNQFQATLWFTWKRINLIVYKPQLDLYRVGNQWRNLIEVSEIAPFERRVR